MGIAASVGALYAFPAVDQDREASIISVTANGGTTEAFHINIPTDRIMVGAQHQQTALPPNMNWPNDDLLAGVRAEMFKLRNARDAVVGVASRVATNPDEADLVEWVVHLPARGSIYISMNSPTAGSQERAGEIDAGSREFAQLRGSVSERWVSDTSGELDAPAGRIELHATYVGQGEPPQ